MVRGITSVLLHNTLLKCHSYKSLRFVHISRVKIILKGGISYHEWIDMWLDCLEATFVSIVEWFLILPVLYRGQRSEGLYIIERTFVGRNSPKNWSDMTWMPLVSLTVKYAVQTFMSEGFSIHFLPLSPEQRVEWFFMKWRIAFLKISRCCHLIVLDLCKQNRFGRNWKWLKIYQWFWKHVTCINDHVWHVWLSISGLEPVTFASQEKVTPATLRRHEFWQTFSQVVVMTSHLPD